jgi:hypothetical protein
VTLEHKHSDYKKFELYQRGVGKEEWKRDKIWVVSRVIVEKKLPGWQRLKFLLDKAKKAISSTKDHDGTKYTRDEDMFLRVLAVLAAIGCKSPLSIFDNKFMMLRSGCGSLLGNESNIITATTVSLLLRLSVRPVLTRSRLSRLVVLVLSIKTPKQSGQFKRSCIWLVRS